MNSADGTGNSDEDDCDVKFPLPRPSSGATNSRQSNAWLYYVKDLKAGIATCLFCQKKIPHKYGCGTSNLHRHLRLQHFDAMPPEYQQKYAAYINRSGQSAANPPPPPSISRFEQVDFNLYTEIPDLESELGQLDSAGAARVPPAIRDGQPRLRGSIVWQHFSRLSDRTVLCSLCSRTYRYDKGSTSNMLKHLQLGHRHVLQRTTAATAASNTPAIRCAPARTPKAEVSAANDSDPGDDDDEAEPEQEPNADSSDVDYQPDDADADYREADADADDNADDDDMTRPAVVASSSSATGRKVSAVWQHFRRLSDRTAQCLHCSSVQVGQSTSNLIKHLTRRHANVRLAKAAVPDAGHRSRPKRATVWRYFSVSKRTKHAACLLCDAKLAYVWNQSTANLKRHMRAKHPDVGDDDDEDDDDDAAVAADSADDGDQSAAIEPPAGDRRRSLARQPPPTAKAAPKSGAFDTWKYYKMSVAQQIATCLLCKKKFAHTAHSSTGNLRKHLRARHADSLSSDSEVEDLPVPVPAAAVVLDATAHRRIPESPKTNAQRNNIGAPKAAGPLPISGAQFKQLETRLLQLLRTELVAEQPADTYAPPFATPREREHLSAKLLATRKRMQRILSLADHVALTVATVRLRAASAAAAAQSDDSDSDSDANDSIDDDDDDEDDDDAPLVKRFRPRQRQRQRRQRSVRAPVPCQIAVSAHCIGRSDWQLHTMLLGSAQLDDSTAAAGSQAAVDYVRALCSEWRIADKVFAFVAPPPSDNCCSTATTVEAAAMGWPRLECVDGRLSGCIADKMSFNEFEFVRLKVNAIVQVFKANGDAAAKFQHFQREHGLAALQLIDDQVLQWRSTLRMFQRLCALQVPLDATLDILRNENRLSTGDWMTIRDMRMQLGLLDGAIEELRSRHRPSAALVCVMLRGLAAQLDALQDSEFRGETIKEFGRQLHAALGAYAVADVDGDLLLSLCSMLDPRFRRYGFVQQAALERCKEHVAEQVRQLAPGAERKPDAAPVAADSATTTTTTGGSGGGGLWSWLDRMVADERNDESEQTTVQHELQFYLNNTPIERHADPLQWWRQHGTVTCPILALVARKYLALPATCAASQRALAHLERWLGTEEATGQWQLDMQTAHSVVFLLENMEHVQ